MTHVPAQDPVDAAREYEAALVPALMAEWAPRLIAAAAIRPGHRVLDVACGTGVLTRAVADAVGPDGSVIGLDVDPGMLTIARSTRTGIAFLQGSASDLPCANASFDATVSQFGMMFFPDPPRAIREMWRALKPGGHLVIAVWASLAETPAYDIETRLVERIGGRATSVPMRMPFSMGDRSTFAAQFEAAGVPLRSLETLEGTGHFPSIRAMVEADIVGWLPVMGVQLPPDVITSILAAAEEELAPYRQADGTVAFASPAHLAVAEKPAP